MSYTNLIYHIIFRTKHNSWAINQENERLLYRYIWGYIKARNCKLYQINGMPDHLHLLIGLHSTISVADFVQQLKNATHLFLEQNKPLFPDFYAWAKGYCALTYAEKDKTMIRRYIQNQKIHHQAQIFSDEMKFLLQESGIEIDESFFDRNL